MRVALVSSDRDTFVQVSLSNGPAGVAAPAFGTVSLMLLESSEGLLLADEGLPAHEASVRRRVETP